MPVRLGCPPFSTKNVQVENTNTEEHDNDNGAEQPLKMKVRLKTCHKKTLGPKKKQEIWVGTMAHAPAIGSLPYGGFTKVDSEA